MAADLKSSSQFSYDLAVGLLDPANNLLLVNDYSDYGKLVVQQAEWQNGFFSSVYSNPFEKKACQMATGLFDKKAMFCSDYSEASFLNRIEDKQGKALIIKFVPCFGKTNC